MQPNRQSKVIGTLFCFALILVIGVSIAEAGSGKGAGSGGQFVSETIKWRSLKNQRRKATIRREVIIVPQKWGDFYGATSGSSISVQTVSGNRTTTTTTTNSVLWYESKEGTLRNVVLQDAGNLVQIERQ